MYIRIIREERRCGGEKRREISAGEHACRFGELNQLSGVISFYLYVFEGSKPHRRSPGLTVETITIGLTHLLTTLSQ